MSSHSAPSSSKRPEYIRPSEPEHWEPYKEIITELYCQLKLKDVMDEMVRTHHFKATSKQYKTQIKKWSLDTKYTKSSEYLAMIKTKRRREKEEPPKKTKFVLHGKAVSDKDITRFERRAIKKGVISKDGGLSDQGSVEGLSYMTPSPPQSYIEG